MQQIVVLLILALVWAAVLVPQHVRNRAEARPADSIGAFRKQLLVLERTTPGAGMAPATRIGAQTRSANALPAYGAPVRARALVRKRRKDILSGLLAATVGAILLGFIPGLGVMHGLALVLGALLTGYVALLVRLRNTAEERELKVRYLPQQARRAPEPALLLRRSGS